MTVEETTTEEFDALFDEGEDLTPYIAEDTIRNPNQEDCVRKINLSMTEWMVDELDKAAKHLGISRQALINVWIADRIEVERAKRDRLA